MEKHILQEAFKALDVLEEDAFNLSDTGSMDDFSAFIKDDDTEDEISIIDPDTDSEDGLQDNYVGKVILDCAVCHSKLYFDPKDVVVDEDEDLVNVGTECPYCYSVDGYKIIGEVAPYEETEEVEEKEEDIETEEEKDDDSESLDESLDESAGNPSSDNFLRYCDTDEQVTALRKIQRCASRLGFNIHLGTKIGKYPQTLILDHGYQDNAIYIHSNGSVEIGGVEIGNWKDEYFDPSSISSKDITSALKELMNGPVDEGVEDALTEPLKEAADSFVDDNLGESLVKRITEVLSRLNEAEMSDEDRADTELLKGILAKTQKRANAKLTPEEKAVLDKYGLTRDSYTKHIRKTRSTPISPVLDTTAIETALSRKSGGQVNLADRARKMGTRGTGYSRELSNGYYSSPHDPQRGRPEVPDKKYKKYGWTTTKSKGLLDAERQAENDAMYEPVGQMKRALSDKKRSASSLASMDARYQAELDDAKAAYDKKVASIERTKEYQSKWDADRLSRAQDTIDTLLKRKDDRVDTEVDESLKESYRDLNDPTDWIRNFLKYHPFDTADEFIDYLEENGYLEKLEDQFQTDVAGAIDEYFDELDESLNEGFEKVDIETENEKMTMTADEDGKVSVTTEPKEETIVPVEQDTKDEIAVANTDDNMRDTVDVDVDEFDEESFDELGESYFKKNYSNVDSYKTTKITESNDKLVVEGLIKFNSGKEKTTTFIFESKDATKSGKIRFIGENQQITRGHKSFTLSGSVNDKKFIAESFNYNYRAKDNDGNSVRLYGTVRSKINEAADADNESYYGVFEKGGSIGSKSNDSYRTHEGSLYAVHKTADGAKDHAKRLRKMLSPGEKSYYGMGYTTRKLTDKELNDPAVKTMIDKKLQENMNEADEHPDLTGKENSISTILMKNKSKIDSAKSKDELIKVLTDALEQKGGQKAQEVLRIAKSKKDLTAALTYVYNFILKGEHKGTIGSKKRYK